jgi:hypothetical protein
VIQAMEGSLYLNNNFSMFCLDTIINLKSLMTLDNLYLHCIVTASPIFIVICAADKLICVFVMMEIMQTSFPHPMQITNTIHNMQSIK